MPFVSRFMHEQVVSMLELRIEDLDRERRIYLDRLASAGFGGPLFATAAIAQSDQSQEDEVILTPEQREAQKMRALLRRPSGFAAAVTSKLRRLHRQSQESVAKGLHVARLSPEEIDAQLDKAEAEGKVLAS